MRRRQVRPKALHIGRVARWRPEGGVEQFTRECVLLYVLLSTPGRILSPLIAQRALYLVTLPLAFVLSVYVKRHGMARSEGRGRS